MSKSGIGKIIFSEEQIQQRVAEVAGQINRDYAGQKLIIVGILKGSFYFVADLTRHLTMPVKIDFISIGTSPEDLNITEGIQFTRSPQISLTGRHVLLVEDIIGTGLTLGYICQHLESSQPASLKICSLLDNPEGRILTINTDYCCFTMPNISVVGYGLDYNEEYRNLRYIAEYRV